MKKLLCLCLDSFTHDQVFSWPMKHLGAEVSIYGGKLTGYRLTALRVLAHLAPVLDLNEPLPDTATISLVPPA